MTDVAGQHAQIGIAAAKPLLRNTHPEAQWFPEARLGVFFHWGISSVFGIGDLSWSMIKQGVDFRHHQCERYGPAAVQAKMTPEKYWSQAERFQPDRYDPRAWLRAAKKAGAAYAVLTTKHHDGYALWPSAHGDFSTRTHMGGRDLVGEYVEACRAEGLKVGLYYSPPDWWFNRAHMSFHYGKLKPDLGVRHEPVTLPVLSPGEEKERMGRFQAFIRGQVEELLTRYGRIDLLWFDGEGYDAIEMARLRELQPGIVINSRAHGTGDFMTPECSFPKAKPAGWWEMCHIWNDGAWGYLTHETYKPLGWMLSEFARCRSWGGNLLINVAPDARGELPPTAYRRLAELERWMGHSGDALRGESSDEWPERSNVPTTRRGGTLYAHALFSFGEPIRIRGIGRPASVRLLRTGEEIAFVHDGGELTIDLPLDLRTAEVDVVEIVAGPSGA